MSLSVGSKRTGIPRANSRLPAYADIKPRTDTGLRSPKGGSSVKLQSKRYPHLKDVFQGAAESKLHRSSSAIDIRPRKTRYPMSVASYPLRKSKSLGDIFAQYTRSKGPKISVDYEFFEEAVRSRMKTGRGGMKRPRTSLGFPRLSIDVTRGGGKFMHSPLNRPERKDAQERENNLRTLRPILRRTKPSHENERPFDGEELPKGDTDAKSQDLELKRNVKWETPKSPSRETTINGIPLSKLSKQGTKATSKSSKPGGKVEEVEKKSIEEDEKEGARNFARCLLGILPSVLSLSEPQAVDEALQQFASDVCEAVCCMALKRKNVPNFGTLMRQFENEEGSDNGDPLLNADGVYMTVLETLSLNYSLNKTGYYKKKTVEPGTSQVCQYLYL